MYFQFISSINLEPIEWNGLNMRWSTFCSEYFIAFDIANNTRSFVGKYGSFEYDNVHRWLRFSKCLIKSIDKKRKILPRIVGLFTSNIKSVLINFHASTSDILAISILNNLRPTIDDYYEL